MNVIVANEQQSKLTNLDVDIIKNISGIYSSSEIVEMFKNFFYSKMILDVTALKKYTELTTYEELTKGLDAEKIVFLLPEGSSLCTSNFLSHLISIGIYNFTTNIEGVKFLLKKSNTLKDVEHIQKMGMTQQINYQNNVVGQSTGAKNFNISPNNFSSVTQMVNQRNSIIIGIKNVTEHAGATTFTYMLKKEIAANIGKDNVVALEIDKSDFPNFNDKAMLSVSQSELRTALAKLSNIPIILIDMNNLTDDTMCSDIIYLLEPSTIKLNKLIKRNKIIFQKLQNKRVILNMSMLQDKDVSDFEKESTISIYFNMPPLDERSRNGIMNAFLTKFGLLGRATNGQKDNSNKIFGLFRR